MKQRTQKLMSLDTQTKLLIWDLHGFSQKFDYKQLLIEEGFSIILYEDVEAFRYRYESELRNSQKKYAIIVQKDIYVPYDVKKEYKNINLSLKHLYPRLNEFALERQSEHLALIDMAYDGLYTNQLHFPLHIFQDCFPKAVCRQYQPQ